MITQQSVETDKVAEEVVDQLALNVRVANRLGDNLVADAIRREAIYRHRLAAAQLRIERSLQAQQ